MIPLPTVEYVEARGGVMFGEISWPPTEEDLKRYDAVDLPKGHILHEHHVTKTRVVLYSLPWEFKYRGAFNDVRSCKYETSKEKK